MSNGHRYWNIARSDYKSILSIEALRHGAKFEFGAGVHDIELTTTKVTLDDGRSFQADLIIGADGTYCANVCSK
jgi:2-polyprenyl-6-methoxyphenol hydroxylase-like FAD-dependent oxidoreductase